MASEPVEKTMDSRHDVKEALLTLRRTIEDSKRSEAETLEIVKRCDKTLDKFEDLKAKYVNETSERKKLYTSLTDRIVGIEKSMTRFSPKSYEYSQGKQDIAIFSKMLRYGESQDKAGSLTPEETKLLRTDDNVQGGFLAPDDFIALILKKIVEISPVRSVARIMTVSNAGAILMPKRESLVTAKYTGQAVAVVPDNSTYGLETLNLNALVAATRATNQMLNDAKFDMENQITLDVADAMAKTQGAAFVNGTAVGQPEGFMTNTAVPIINSGIANDIDGDSLIELTGELASGQNPIFAFNRRTRAAIRSLKDTSGAYLFQLDIGLQAALATTLVGFPFIEMIDMDDIAVDTFPIIFGDFSRGYLIIDGASLSVQRDPFTKALENIVVFVWTMFNGGQVILTDAFIKLKVSV